MLVSGRAKKGRCQMILAVQDDELLAELTSRLMLLSLQCLPPLPPIAKDKHKETHENNIKQICCTGQHTEYLSMRYKHSQDIDQRFVLHSVNNLNFQ